MQREIQAHLSPEGGAGEGSELWRVRFGIIHTPHALFNVVSNFMLFNPTVLSLCLAFLLDVTIAGTPEERGLHVWRSRRLLDRSESNDRYARVYHLPWGIGARYFAWASWL